jgi:hypothetical protein
MCLEPRQEFIDNRLHRAGTVGPIFCHKLHLVRSSGRGQDFIIAAKVDERILGPLDNEERRIDCRYIPEAGVHRMRKLGISFGRTGP